MNTDEYKDGKIREWIKKSEMKAPPGMSDRIMNAVNTAHRPVAQPSFGKVRIYFIISLILMPVALFFTDEAFSLFAQSLGDMGKYFVFYEYTLIAAFTGFALFQIDFFMKNVMWKDTGFS